MIQGLSTELSILQHAVPFEDEYPPWNTDRATLDNIIVEEGAIMIEDTTVRHGEDVTVTRFLTDTEEQWLGNAEDINRFQILDDDTGTYITREEDLGAGVTSSYLSEEFYNDAADIVLEYRYRELTDNPEPVELTLSSTDAGITETITLEPGTPENDYVNSYTFSNNQEASDWNVEVVQDAGVHDEQRLYSLEFTQDLQSVDGGSGLYSADVVRSGDLVQINDLGVLGDNIKRNGANQRKAFLTVYGFDDGGVVEEHTFEVTNQFVGETGNLFEEEVNSYSFDILLTTESTGSPRVQEASFAGFTEDRLVDRDFTSLWQLAFLMFFVGFVLFYMVRG